MARCEQGYLCDVCGDEVEDITSSDLYLRFVLGEVDARELLASPERHIRCNPVQAQFIDDPDFVPVHVEGMFGKQFLSDEDCRGRTELVTKGWKRLNEVRDLGIPVSEYPLEEVRRRKSGR